MQFHIKMANSGIFSIPLNYNYQVQSAIYALLRHDEKFSAALHDIGYGELNAYRMFTFGALQGNYAIHNKKLHFDGDFSLEIRSVSDAFCHVLKEAILNQGTIRLFDQVFEIAELKITDYQIEMPEITVLTDSPVIAKAVTETNHTIYYAPEESEFTEQIQANFQSKFKAFYGENCPDKIIISPLGRHRKVVTRYKQLWLTAYYGKFRLAGSEEVLNFLYNTGLGAKNSQGFGMFQVIGE